MGICLLLPLMMAALSGISERAARSLGRVLIVLFRGLGICLLVTMALLEAWAAPDDPFVGTNATQNATLSNGLFCFTSSGAGANSTAPAASELSARLWWRHAGRSVPPAWATANGGDAAAGAPSGAAPALDTVAVLKVLLIVLIYPRAPR